MGREECEESLLNKNVNWIHSSPFWVFYGLLILFFRLWMPFFVPERHAWTGTNVVHGIISFVIMHWIKGSPDENEMRRGDYKEFTFYEQIDNGRPWTDTKKGLILVPTILFMIASVATNYATLDLVINFPVWLILILGKLPEFHRVRLFGINATVGIDDDDGRSVIQNKQQRVKKKRN